MNRILNPLLLLGLGAGAMYFYDPAHGRRRRAIARDKATSVVNRSASLATKTREDLSNRARGLAANTAGLFRSKPSSDDVVAGRINAKMGRVISHPHAIRVSVQNGVAILKGHVLSSEIKELVAATGAVPGVRAVENQLELHEQPGFIPSLQGGSPPARTRFVLAKEHWPPAARLLTGCAGGAAILYGLSRGGILGKLVALAGSALIVRSATNLDFSHLTGIGAGARAVDLRKTITINAPIERVFNFLANFKNYPRFMAHVRDVQQLDNGRSHWTVVGPGGATLEWTSTETQFIPYQLLAWTTEPDSAIQHTGLVRFAQAPGNATRLDIFMSYNPVAGAIGHLVARILGSDPKSTLDSDLVRFKSLCEQGKATIGGQSIRSEELDTNSTESP